MIKVFFDASVIIAALLSPNGGSAKLLQLAKKGMLIAITSQTVVAEVLKHQQKIKKTKKEIEEFLTQNPFLIRQKIKQSETEKYQNLIDVNDCHLIAGANLTKSQCLVTLDKKHLLTKTAQSNVKPLKMVSPKELIAELLIKNPRLLEGF